MALQSEAAHTPSIGFGALWGSFGEVDRTRLQWQAPTTRTSKAKEPVSKLPKWLAGWGQAAEEAVVAPLVPPVPERRACSFFDELRTFRTAIKYCCEEKRSRLCDEFSRILKQNLILGLDSEEIVSRVLQIIPGEIWTAFSDSEEANRQCLKLFQSMWEGISTCKVMQPSDLSDEILAQMIETLSKLSTCEEVLHLAESIISSKRMDQVTKIIPSIILFVNSCMHSWSHLKSTGSCAPLLAVAERAATIAERSVLDLQNLITTVEKESLAPKHSEALRKALEQARKKICQAADAVVKSDDFLIPQRQRFKSLAVLLRHVPGHRRRQVIKACSFQIANPPIYMGLSMALVRNNWLSFIANASNMTSVILSAWRRLQTTCAIQEDIASDVILDLWVNQGCFKQPGLIRVLFDVIAQKHNSRDYSSLLFAINSAGEDSWGRTMSLFKFLDMLGRGRTVQGHSYHHTIIVKQIARMMRLEMHIPEKIMDETLELMTANNHYDLAKVTLGFFQQMPTYKKPLQLELCPSFVSSMIDDASNSSDRVWNAFGIPVYEHNYSGSPATHAFVDPNTPPLSSATIEVVTKMAIQFAHLENRSSRFAFRNVTQCIHFLRRHHVPITPELTRALMHAGITRKILDKTWISKERVKWILSLIEQAEGTEVAKTVDRVVATWNEDVANKTMVQDSKIKRESDVLRGSY